MMNRLFSLGLIALLLALALPAWSWETDLAPASARWPVRPLAEVDRTLTPDLDRAALAREDLDREEQGLPYRYASVYEVSLTPANAGTWENLPSGRSLWRLRVTARDALTLNLGFSRFWLPANATMLVYAPGENSRVLAYDETDQDAHGELWTPVLPGDDLVVELEVDPSLRWQVELELTSIGRGYRFFGEDISGKSGSCNIDVICPEGDDWRKEIDSVAVYSMGGSTVCSGFMVNNTAQDGTPYFMTAYHCNVRANLAPSLVVYWNFQSPSCGQHGGGTYDDSQSGSILLAEYPTTDFTLLELDDDPDPAYGVKFAGWYNGSGVPTSAVGIHHPSTDEKSISFENQPLTVTTYQSFVSPGDGTHLRVGDWDVGTTEPGSSGSPLFDQNHHVVGQLHGGGAACNNDLSDWYGWFHVSWDGGGTDDSRLSNWLDPGSTGETSVETMDPFGSSFTVTPTEALVASGVQGGPFLPEDVVYTLTNTGDAVATFTASAAATWLTITPASGSIPVGQSMDVTVGFASSVSTLGVGTYQATVDIVNDGQGAGTTSRPVTLTVYANVPRITGVVPNPFGGSAAPETEIRFTLGGNAGVSASIYDLRGRLVKDLGSMAGVPGPNHFTWDGTGPGGARLPSGSYYLILEALGQEEKASIMLIH